MVRVNHPGKANIIADTLRRLFMDSTTHVQEEERELEKDVHSVHDREFNNGFHIRRNSGHEWG